MKDLTKLLCLILILTLTIFSAFAQSMVVEESSVSGGQTVILNFPYADLVEIVGVDGSTIKVEAKVYINQGRNNDAYILEKSSKNSELIIKGTIPNYDDLPKMITIRGDDQTYYFETEDWNSPEIQKFLDENGRDGWSWNSRGVARDISVNVSVPRTVSMLEVTSKFGLIDVENFNGSLKLNSTHGGIDVEFDTSNRNELVLESQWGTIYSNVNLQIETMDGFEKRSDWDHVIGLVNGGGGPKMELSARHSNIYLRRK